MQRSGGPILSGYLVSANINLFIIKVVMVEMEVAAARKTEEEVGEMQRPRRRLRPRRRPQNQRLKQRYFRIFLVFHWQICYKLVSYIGRTSELTSSRGQGCGSGWS